MSLTIQHLNGDASFLLSFKPILQSGTSTRSPPQPFSIVLDPWLIGSSKILHKKFSISQHRKPSFVDSLSDLAHEPDLVIISQDQTDHCHAPTLRTLLPNIKTVILANPASAKAIRSWRYFDSGKVVAMKRWDSKTVDCIWSQSIPPLEEGGLAGQVTVAYLTPTIDLTGLHSAIGITYRPPTAYRTHYYPSPGSLVTPPPSPGGTESAPRTLSVIFSPHGIPYTSLHPYVQSHLLQETASIPLTALLHCFDRLSNPWYLGGNICAGFPGGLEIAGELQAETWISAHDDDDKETTGIATKKLVIQKWNKEEVMNLVGPRGAKGQIGGYGKSGGTNVVVLGVGEEIVLGV